MASFDTEVIQDGAVALAALARLSPAIVLLDLHLPRVSGKTILHCIRNNVRLQHIPVILATADSQVGEDLRADSDLVLLKPISISQLRDLASRLHP